MPSIQSLGVGSGLLTSDLLEDIIAAEREATDLRLTAKRSEFEAEISAFGAVRSSLDTFRSAASSLSTSSSLLTNATTSSDEALVTATATASANPGTHEVEVLATARAQTLTSLRYDSPDAVVGDGLLDIRFGTTTFVDDAYDSFEENTERASVSLTIDSTNNTLSGIRDAINASDSGVLASVVNDGQGFVLALRSAQTGAAHSLEISVTEGVTAGLSALAFNAAASAEGVNLTQSLAASDASAIVDGLTISRETNQIDEVIPGITFDLLAASEGKAVIIGVNKDVEAITENLQGFIDAYNELKTLTDELTAFDSEDGVGALLTGDATLRTLNSQVRNLLSRSVEGITSNNVRALVDIGISTNQNSGFNLQFDAQQFQSALLADPEAVTALLANDTSATDPLVEVIGFQNDSQAGSYSLEITQAASQAQIQGATTPALSGAITIDADNDELSVTVDGVSSGTVVLAQATYGSGQELAQEIESQINQDANLRAAARTIEVRYDDTLQSLVLSSARFGSNSSVGIDAIDTNTLAVLGLSVDAAENNVGLDVEGTVNGIEGVGNGQFLSIPSGPVAATASVYEGLDAAGLASFPFVIDASNDEISVSVDGTTSSPITITNGSYDSGAEIASAIESQINADANLVAAGRSVSVRFDAPNNRFEISSGSTGSTSSVAITASEAGVVSDLGLSVASGTPGANASNVADPAAGIQVRVQGETVGDRGTVSVVRGVMDQIQSFIRRFTSFGGTLSNKVDSLQEQIADIDQQEVDFNERIDLLEERLRLQFASADALISTLNNTGQFLDRQLDSLPGFTRDNG